MKAFTIRPTSELYSSESNKKKSEEVIERITGVVLDTVKSWEDCYFWEAFIDEDVNYEDRKAGPVINWVKNYEQMYDLVRDSIDPNNINRYHIRSAFSCRIVSFGWDGQVLLCMRLEDVEPPLREEEVIVVERRDELITGSDFFDG